MASLFLGELNDFISLSQACINPAFTGSVTNDSLKQKNSAKIKLSVVDELGNNEIEHESRVLQSRPNLIQSGPSQKKGGQKATISLSDCLACSGCVTSAETVLLQQQSTTKFKEMVESGQFDVIVVSVSPQTVATFSIQFEISYFIAFNVISTFLKHEFSVSKVLNTIQFLDFSLLESAEEFIHRMQHGNLSAWVKPSLSYAQSSTVTVFEDSDSSINDPVPYEFVPMLASECPGWVCYAEKTTPEALPFISTTKSPQQIAGTFIKGLGARCWGCNPRKILHITVMPCYDKKLEASRKDFWVDDPGGGYFEVDLVLTTTELLELVKEKAESTMETERSNSNIGAYVLHLTELKLPEQSSCVLESPLFSSFQQEHLFAGFSAHGGSGGYLEYIARTAAKRLLGIEIQGPLNYCQGRNPDFQEVKIEVEGKPPLLFARAYGFRNIQACINKMKKGRLPYHFVELMACPGGCLNGGGQMKVSDGETPIQKKERLDQLDSLYESSFAFRLPENNPVVAETYKDFLGGSPFSDAARNILHTRYHAVPKLENSNPAVTLW